MARLSAARILTVLAALGGGAFPAAAQAGGAPEGGSTPQAVRVEIRDVTPRFLRFYDAALGEGAGPERRWELWKEHYDFAALPPVPERDSLARAMLDAAWPEYPAVMERIRGGAAAMRPAPAPTLRSVASLLEADSLTVRLIAYVGGLEKNAYFYAHEGTLNVVVPVEADPEWRETTLAHEFTHAVHHRLAGFSEGWERSIARTLFAEGLAMRVTQALFPDLPGESFVEHRPGWLAEAESRREEILRGILPALRARDSETVMRFTMGRGATGIEREAYYAGWIVLDHLLQRGWTLADLARLSEEEIPGVVETAIRELLRKPSR